MMRLTTLGNIFIAMDEKGKQIQKLLEEFEKEHIDKKGFTDFEKKKLIQFMNEMRTIDFIGDDLVWLN